jgi:hypothetical protein
MGDAGGANHIDIERQMMTVLFDCAAWYNANFAEVDRIVDFGPGQLFVAKFRGGAAHWFSVEAKQIELKNEQCGLDAKKIQRELGRSIQSSALSLWLPRISKSWIGFFFPSGALQSFTVGMLARQPASADGINVPKPQFATPLILSGHSVGTQIGNRLTTLVSTWNEWSPFAARQILQTKGGSDSVPTSQSSPVFADRQLAMPAPRPR